MVSLTALENGKLGCFFLSLWTWSFLETLFISYFLIVGLSVTMATIDSHKGEQAGPGSTEVAGAPGSVLSPQSEAVTNELQELSLQPAPNLLPLQERKNGETAMHAGHLFFCFFQSQVAVQHIWVFGFPRMSKCLRRFSVAQVTACPNNLAETKAVDLLGVFMKTFHHNSK